MKRRPARSSPHSGLPRARAPLCRAGTTTPTSRPGLPLARARFRLLAVPFLVALAAATPAAASENRGFDLEIERDTRPRTSILADLTASYRVTVRDKATGGPPERHVVFAHAVDGAGEKSIAFACGHTNDVDSRTPPGVYDCTVIVDYGGQWTFVATLHEEASEPGRTGPPLAKASVPFNLSTGEAGDGGIPGAELSASRTDVAILFGHTSVAVAWFACVALLATLALPGARRYLSPLGRHHLERRLDLIVKGTWVTTGLVLGSGVYLTLSQTAYEAPFSTSAVDAVFTLPYGKPYFLALWTKIGLYAAMAGATVPLLLGARRRLSSVDAPVVNLEADDEGPELQPLPVNGGAVACDIRTTAPAVVAQPDPANQGLRIAVLFIAAGAVGIGVCVTILKYLHELIETARGLL